MHAAVKAWKFANHTKGDPHEELKAYLIVPLEAVEDVIMWWGLRAPLTVFCLLLTCIQQHSLQYPTLARMAQDYLAIQGSATPSERAFSHSGITDTKRRNHLSPVIFEALQLLKSGYHNGYSIFVHQTKLLNIRRFWKRTLILVTTLRQSCWKHSISRACCT
jgi:hypothetical protein